MFKSFKELLSVSDKNTDPINDCLFSDVCPTGYFKKEEFLKHLHDISEDPKKRWQLVHLKLLFDLLRSNADLSRDPQHTTEDGQNLTWLKVRIGKVTKSLKIYHFASIKQLIDDYSLGNLKVTQTLEELYNEALS